ncbi:hypothetical protein B0T25DRAFT_536916 [Lasiosphaeria hispida]|uniref:AB hydrolase-1 domain-containing protein n=1 Tax=Lasiosphaeria hispida TaxID=260671 RepID=A0AAJ0HKI2_9PEZI|nr:hypothetical protein B0T25DRAFT_536916 [Lasiosphaeria hispida]
MEPFTLVLANGAALTGLTNLPGVRPTSPTFKPLIVGVHGGTYSSAYFDVDAKHTAALASNALNVPWVGIDRPGYKGTTSFYPIHSGSSYPEMDGEWLHKFILPAIWREFGEPQGCNSMVLLCHSLGVPAAVIAAAMLAEEVATAANYPLSGIILSGFGTQLAAGQGPPQLADASAPPEFANMPPEVKDAILLPPGTCDPSAYEHTARLNTSCRFEEVNDIHTVWIPHVKTAWAPLVRVPVMIGLAERDCFWAGDTAHLKDFEAAFTASPSVSASLIKRAPHNLEMSFWSQGWYARCFGFALECAASFGVALRT